MYTVVVADDEVELRDAIVKTIKWEEIGFSVVGAAENGIEALELVELLEPDLLLTDIKMPFVSGLELARRAREIRPAMNIAFLSGYDDFSFAQQAIQYNIISYLLKPISAAELTKELTAIRKKIDEKIAQFKFSQDMADISGQAKKYRTEAFLLSVFLDGEAGRIQGGTKKGEELERMAASLELRKSEEGKAFYLIFITQLANEEGDNITTPEHCVFVDAVLKKYVKYGSAYSNQKIISLVSSSERDLKKFAGIFTKEIIQNAKRVWSAQCAIGISREFERLEGANEAYLDAVAACEYSQKEKNEPFFISDMENVGIHSSEYISTITAELERLLKIGDKDTLEQCLKDTFQNKGKKNSNFLMLQIISTIYEAASGSVEAAGAEELLKRYSFSQKLYTNYSYNGTEEEVIRFALEARELISKKRRLNSEVICEEAMQIIQKEYRDEELTLAALSERLHVSSGYLSTLIKKIKGESFVNLLTGKRMEMAKEELLCTSDKILEIANNCGYSDHHYFSYCFKKFYGISPNKMRETVRNG